MTKKIKDVTLEEREEICHKQKWCQSCPYKIVPYLGNADIGCKLIPNKYTREFGEEEIEI